MQEIEDFQKFIQEKIDFLKKKYLSPKKKLVRRYFLGKNREKF